MTGSFVEIESPQGDENSCFVISDYGVRDIVLLRQLVNRTSGGRTPAFSDTKETTIGALDYRERKYLGAVAAKAKVPEHGFLASRCDSKYGPATIAVTGTAILNGAA